jgi:two-component system, NarL family, sensor histidine kinase DesK
MMGGSLWIGYIREMMKVIMDRQGATDAVEVGELSGRTLRASISAQHQWMFRWPPLLYTVFWFISPWYRHTVLGWCGFALFYGTFLLAYYKMFRDNEPPRIEWLAVMFALGYLNYPFNRSAAGEFVFPVVMSVFFLCQTRMYAALWRFGVIAAAQAIGVLVETAVLHRDIAIAESVIFYTVAIGLSNFAYARHVMASEQLERANLEIEHLTQVAERERIARDLHDLLGHTLTVIALKSDVANRLFDIEPELAHREIAEVQDTARKALAEIRDAVTGYRAEGLAAEVARARRSLTSAGVELRTEMEFMALPEPATNTLCLVLREAVTNAIRHAGATTCRLEVHREGDVVTMSIEDDGSGELKAEGNGLRGMRERLTVLGGSLLRERAVSGGTRLVATLRVVSGVSADAARPRVERDAVAFGAVSEGPVQA